MIPKHNWGGGMIEKQEADELSTMKELLAAALQAVIAESLNVNVDRVQPDCRLVADLEMCPPAKRRLQREIAFLFDCADLEIPPAMRVEDLVERITEIELARL